MAIRRQADYVTPASTDPNPFHALAGLRPPAWTEQARCAEVDPDLWHPEKGGSSKEAKALCARCPVAAECLDYALENQERFGIWGGMSERERRKLTKDQPA